jgi:hypothetical protein
VFYELFHIIGGFPVPVLMLSMIVIGVFQHTGFGSKMVVHRSDVYTDFMSYVTHSDILIAYAAGHFNKRVKDTFFCFIQIVHKKSITQKILHTSYFWQFSDNVMLYLLWDWQEMRPLFFYSLKGAQLRWLTST